MLLLNTMIVLASKAAPHTDCYIEKYLPGVYECCRVMSIVCGMRMAAHWAAAAAADSHLSALCHLLRQTHAHPCCPCPGGPAGQNKQQHGNTRGLSRLMHQEG
jgi:hypothetical protein